MSTTPAPESTLDFGRFFTLPTNGTVGELIDALSQYPRDLEVVADTEVSPPQWRLVWTVQKPYANERLSKAVALSLGAIVR